MSSLIIKERQDTPEGGTPHWARRLIQITGGLLILAILYSIYIAKSLLLPLAVAMLLAGLLQPLVHELRRLRIPEPAGAAIVVLALFSIVGFTSYRLSFPAAEWFKRGPYLLWEAEFKLDAFFEVLRKTRHAARQLEEAAELDKAPNEKEEVVIQEPTITERIMSHTQSAFATVIITLVLLYFILARGSLTLERFVASLADPDQGEKWRTLLFHIQQEITRYLVTITLINTALGIVTGTTMALLGMPNPILWGVVGGLLNFIPYLGSMITALILAMVSIISFDTPAGIVLPPLMFLVYTGLEGQFITPMVLGKRLSLNPLILMISLLFWGWLWGIPGMLLAVPIQASMKIILKNVPSMFSLREILR
jgi:predicted PurR-regulated permease PerM